MDGLLNEISTYLKIVWEFLVYAFLWFLPANNTPTQVMLSIFKIGAVLLLVYIFYDNAHGKAY